LTGLHHWNPKKFCILTIKSFVNHKDFFTGKFADEL